MGTSFAPWIIGGALLAVLVVTGCSRDDPATDSGVPMDRAAVGDGGGGPTAPAIPWVEAGEPPVAPPDLTCPDGWRQVVDGPGVATCDPFPEGGAEDCPEGWAHFPGDPACTRVGSPCPAGDYATDLPADRGVVYVRPGATGGDGTMAAPYGDTLVLLGDTVPPSTVVALSRGVHEGTAQVTQQRVLWGACVEETVLRSASPDPNTPVVIMIAGAGGLRNVTIGPSPHRGLGLGASGNEGRLDGVVMTGLREVAVLVHNGARLVAERLVIRDTVAEVGDMMQGRGIEAESGSTVEVTNALLERNREMGLFSDDPGTSVSLADVVIRDTMGRPSDGALGRGIEAVLGATLRVDRALLERNGDVGLRVSGVGTALNLADVVVRDTQGAMDTDAAGFGVFVGDGAIADARRVLVTRNREVGVSLHGEGVRAALTDVVVRETIGTRLDGGLGRGLNVAGGAQLELIRASLEGNLDVAMLVSGTDSALTVTDAAVRDTGSEARSETGGRGLGVQLGASAALSRVILERNRELGIFVGNVGTTATLTDVLIRDTESTVASGFGGRGLGVQIGAVAEVNRAIIEGSREVGVIAIRDEAEVTASDVIVRRSRPRACAESTCPEFPAGHGVGSYEGGLLRLERFVVSDGHMCGVHLARAGQIDLHSGEVHHHTIGACVQVAAYDTARLTNDVVFRDNGVNLDATTLPVPDSAVSIPEAP